MSAGRPSVLVVMPTLGERPDTLTDAMRSALDQEGDSGFTLGETFAFKDLARLALVASSNDAAAAIASTTSATPNRDRQRDVT